MPCYLETDLGLYILAGQGVGNWQDVLIDKGYEMNYHKCKYFDIWYGHFF